MTFNTPRNLHSLAARAFVEDLVLESKVMVAFKQYRRHETDYDFFVHNYKMGSLGLTINRVGEVMKQVLSVCNRKNIESIQQVLRTTHHPFASGVLILQFLFDKELNLRKKHWDIFPLFVHQQIKCPNIEKLIIEHSCLDIYPEPGKVYSKCFQMLPNLKVFKAMMRPDNKCLSGLRKHCRGLREISFIIKGTCLNCNQLCALFFNGNSLKQVKEAFVKLEEVPLTFPNLKSFSMNRIGEDQFGFFKMFIHYYPQVNFPIGLDYDCFSLSSVSWFDAVLSHSVVINPDLTIKHCDLSVHDLFLSFCEKSLMHWKKLDALSISVGLQGKKTPATPTAIGKKLEMLLSKQRNIKDFWIKIHGAISEDELSEIFYPTLKAHGKRFRLFGIVGINHFLGHRPLVNILNYSTNIKQLVLVGKKVNKYLKDAKLKTFNNLEHLTIVWDEMQMNNAVCQWISKITLDFVRNSPNLRVLNCTANIPLLDSLRKFKLESQLWRLVLEFHKETIENDNALTYLFKVLPNLPKLQELVVTYTDTECDLFEPDEDIFAHDCIYAQVSNHVRNTQVHTQYFTVEDDEIKWML